jgi:hypothetical protein
VSGHRQRVLWRLEFIVESLLGTSRVSISDDLGSGQADCVRNIDTGSVQVMSMIRSALASGAMFLAMGTPALADELMYLIVSGEVTATNLNQGPLAALPSGSSFDFRIALMVDQGVVSPWGPVTIFYPVVLERTDLLIRNGEQVVRLTPAPSESGHSLMVTSGTTPDNLTTDQIELPRLALGDGTISVRLRAVDANAASLYSADLRDLRSISSASTFYDQPGDGVTLRLDAASDDPLARPARMLIRFDAYAAPVVCVTDIANDFGELGPDGAVTFGDFLALLSRIGTCPVDESLCIGDFADDFGNPGNDGQVSFGDVLFMLGETAQVCLPTDLSPL